MSVGEPVAHHQEIPRHPFPLGFLGNDLGQFGPHVILRSDLRRHQRHVEALQQSQDLQMVVGINQARGHGFAAQVNHFCFLTDQGADGLVAAYSLDETIFDCHRLGNGVSRVHGDDLAVDEHRISRLLRWGHRGNRDRCRDRCSFRPHCGRRRW